MRSYGFKAKYSMEEKLKIYQRFFELKKYGLTLRQIAQRLGMDNWTLRYIIRQVNLKQKEAKKNGEQRKIS